MSDIRGTNSERISEGGAETIDTATNHQERKKPTKDHPDKPPKPPRPLGQPPSKEEEIE